MRALLSRPARLSLTNVLFPRYVAFYFQASNIDRVTLADIHRDILLSRILPCDNLHVSSCHSYRKVIEPCPHPVHFPCSPSSLCHLLRSAVLSWSPPLSFYFSVGF